MQSRVPTPYNQRLYWAIHHSLRGHPTSEQIITAHIDEMRAGGELA